MTSSPIPAARSQYLLDLLAQIPDPRKRRGRRHRLAGLLAVGIAAVIAGSRSFAAIGQWAADAGPEVLAALGAARGPAEESTFRRAFALIDPGRLDQVLGAWLHTRAVQVSGRLVIAIDGKAVRGARGKDGKAPHLVAALAHGIGAVLGQVAVDAKSNEIPAVRELLKAFAAHAPDQAWKRRSCGNGSKGPRVFDWAAATMPDGDGEPPGWSRYLLVRRSLTRNAKGELELAYYLCCAPAGTADEELIRVAGSRWAIEECFQTAKNETGLDQYQVRRYDAWYRHVTLAMLAHAYLSVTAATAPKALAAASSRSRSARSAVSWHT